MSFTSILSALFTATLPLFLLSCALFSWAMHRGWIAGSSVKELQDNLDALGKAQKDKKQRQQMDPVLHKWFQFGGGFYGVVALYTLIVIEFPDLANFFGSLLDLVLDLSLGGLIGLVLELFIESIMNFVWAIAWPAYWLSEQRNAWMLLFFAYAGYWLGIKAAQYAWDQGWVKAFFERIKRR